MKYFFLSDYASSSLLSFPFIIFFFYLYPMYRIVSRPCLVQLQKVLFVYSIECIINLFSSLSLTIGVAFCQHLGHLCFMAGDVLITLPATGSEYRSCHIINFLFFFMFSTYCFFDYLP